MTNLPIRKMLSYRVITTDADLENLSIPAIVAKLHNSLSLRHSLDRNVGPWILRFKSKRSRETPVGVEPTSTGLQPVASPSGSSVKMK